MENGKYKHSAKESGLKFVQDFFSDGVEER